MVFCYPHPPTRYIIFLISLSVQPFRELLTVNPTLIKRTDRFEWWKNVVIACVLSGIFLGIVLDIWIQTGSEPIAYAQEEVETEVELAEVVLIGVKIDWTRERIIQELKTVFPDEPLIVDVARCESQITHWTEHGHVLQGWIDDDDIGLMQINRRYHGATARKLGYDIYDIQGNIMYARYLYEREGLQPWSASKPCWSKAR